MSFWFRATKELCECHVKISAPIWHRWWISWKLFQNNSAWNTAYVVFLKCFRPNDGDRMEIDHGLTDYAQTITGEVTSVTSPVTVIGRAQPEQLTPSKRKKTGPGVVFGAYTHARTHACSHPPTRGFCECVEAWPTKIYGAKPWSIPTSIVYFRGGCNGNCWWEWN